MQLTGKMANADGTMGRRNSMLFMLQKSVREQGEAERQLKNSLPVSSSSPFISHSGNAELQLDLQPKEGSRLFKGKSNDPKREAVGVKGVKRRALSKGN